MESILTSIKKLLGIATEYKHFDDDLIIHINSVLMTLTQLGVGPKEGYSIASEYETWGNFLPDDQKDLHAIKTYVYMKVKLLFDPPMNSTVMEAMNRQINEIEWRILHAVETKSSNGEEV